MQRTRPWVTRRRTGWTPRANQGACTTSTRPEGLGVKNNQRAEQQLKELICERPIEVAGPVHPTQRRKGYGESCRGALSRAR